MWLPLWTTLIVLSVFEMIASTNEQQQQASFSLFNQDEDAVDCRIGELSRLVSNGDLSSARWMALQVVSMQPACQSTIAKAYKESFDNAYGSIIGQEEFPLQVSRHFETNTHDRIHRKPRAKIDKEDCIYPVREAAENSNPTKEWDSCCSILLTNKKEARTPSDIVFGVPFKDDQGDASCSIANPCCEFYAGSPSHLRLPALHEPALRVRVSLPNGITTLELEQEGYLRPFDVAGILWPSGYLLALCMANPINCQIPEVVNAVEFHHARYTSPVALELGAGVGAPSIALALYLKEHFGDNNNSYTPYVVSTDIAPHALALTMANAWGNGASIHTELLNYTNTTFTKDIKRHRASNYDRFALVVGSSLQALFLDSENPDSFLWKTLDILLDKGNPHALAVLVHTNSDSIKPPRDKSYVLLRKISGDHFGMQSRSGKLSDFEISVFQKAAKEQDDSQKEL